MSHVKKTLYERWMLFHRCPHARILIALLEKGIATESELTKLANTKWNLADQTLKELVLMGLVKILYSCPETPCYTLTPEGKHVANLLYTALKTTIATYEGTIIGGNKHAKRSVKTRA